MIVAIASGKGGTGKTTVCASLASVWPGPVAAVDLDVEEPNLGLFLRPQIASEESAFLEVPLPPLANCTLCGTCVELCQFKAVTRMGGRILVFPEMCHGCGGCLALCPEHSLLSGRRELGTVSEGVVHGGTSSGGWPIRFLSGRLRVGEAMSPPLMREVVRRLSALPAGEGSPMDALLDAPPGVSCPAVSAVTAADAVLLVAEPTPFGLHDFALAVEAFRPLGKPMGVVVNRAGLGDESIQEFCRANGLPVLAEIPFERAIAEAYARSRLIAGLDARLHALFTDLAARVAGLAAGKITEAAHA
ncbi:Cobyrinic acid ac-diamide synthase [Desulfovibrio sp. X2]|uniref:nucleotide-binding protein n=1 Tax=Desulfovibrio sp. X2 TaxID=941449 RepID=UPI0003587E10|nr:ATP-binding protein [Desulfovibrio sp. X2]EPR43515.1 Cobyrinic acid ac-diamide synthase [Desulfovibrio sp. X2]